MQKEVQIGYAEPQTETKEDSCCFTRLMKEPAKLSDVEAKPSLQFRRLYSCCRGHYGYADQFGNEYGVDKNPKNYGITASGSYAETPQYTELRTHPNDDGPAD